MPGSGRAGRPWLGVLDAGQRRDHDRAGLGLPPRVDDRAALAADHLVVPEPGLRVDRLADRPQQPQRAEVVLPRMLGPPLHARADRGRRGVEERHAVALDQLPPDVLVRVVRRALVHDRRGAVGQRPVDDVRVPGDPADVGRAPVDVLLGLEVEHDAVRVRDLREVAAGGVQDALRLRRRAARVEDEQRVLGVQRLGRALVGGGLHDRVPPEVAALLHRAVGARVLHDDHGLEVVEPAHDRVDLLLDRRGLALAARAVDRDQRLRLGELHPLLHRLGAEAAEDDVVRGADARAGEHRHRDLGDHRQEDPDDVAGADAAVLERVGEALDVTVQVRVRDVPLLALLAAPVERDAVAVAGLDVPVDAVLGHVELAADEPLGERRVAPVEHLVPLAGPLQGLGLLGPEPLGIALRPLVHRGVGDDRVLGEAGGRREGLLVQQPLELRLERRSVGHAVSPLSMLRRIRSTAPGPPHAPARARARRPARRPDPSQSARRARGSCARRRARS